MRYNPATDQARDIDAIATECRAAIEKPIHAALWSADDVFYAGACGTWNLCRAIAIQKEDRDTVARMQEFLNRDMHRAMHHRSHQPEY